MAIVDQDAGRTGIQCSRDCCIGLIGHQPAEPVILSRMAGLSRVSLVFVHDARNSLHVDRDVHPHDVSSAYARDEYRGR